MKIYFSASLLYKNQYGSIYKRSIDHLNKRHGEVYERVLTEDSRSLTDVPIHKIKNWYKEWSSYIRDCSCVIIEGSYPSTIHIGFEVGMCVSRGKPVIILYKKGKNPLYLTNYDSRNLITSEYTEDSVEQTIDWCLEEAKTLINRRFTFFIPQEIDSYLNKVSKKRNIPRSEYIRSLIEKDREVNDDQ